MLGKLFHLNSRARERRITGVFLTSFCPDGIDCGRNGLRLQVKTVCGRMNQAMNSARRYDAVLAALGGIGSVCGRMDFEYTLSRCDTGMRNTCIL